ncbi:MAG: cytochrome b N-terminal domain-containing protein [Planctomycetaceae bacterium]|nr:cytochrome b N-terminal domain-containing protein [Planctomycetaceae bacterium]
MLDNFLIWLDDRTGIPSLMHKLRHWTVPAAPCGRFLTVMTAFAFFLQVLTGILLWTFYSPSAQTAWESLFYLQFILPGGWLLRGIHHFSAQLLVVLLGLRFLGLVFSGQYRPPREFVFWTVFAMLLFSLASCLTGDLLSWTLSGFSATLVRVRFLQMLPFIGEPLFRMAAGGTEFGTLTLPRFLVLHILVFGGGFFLLLVLSLFFEYRSLSLNTGIHSRPAKTKRIPLFPDEILKHSLCAFAVMAAVLLLVYHKPLLHTLRPDTFPLKENLPREASLGVPVGAPADPAGFYDASRPEWSFRALYHFCNLKYTDKEGKETDVFPGERKYIPVFVVTGSTALYVLLLPLIGRFFIGHCFNVLVIAGLFGSLCYLTYASYYHDYADPSMQSFRDDEAAAEREAERAVELCLTTAIPPTGALTLTQNDPYLQGPVLYKQHCAVCHPFAPLEGEAEHPDFKPVPCDTPKAPNLYNPVRKEWIAGFLDAKKIRSADYFGNTKFASGSMADWTRGTLREILKDEEDGDKQLDRLADFLVSEARREAPRPVSEPLTAAQAELFTTFDCGQCHKTYAPDSKAMNAPDLRGYFSRDWLIGIIANPESGRFYGVPNGKKGNDAMPAFRLNEAEAVLSQTEIELLTDWLRGKWHRFRKVPPAEAKMQPVE